MQIPKEVLEQILINWRPGEKESCEHAGKQLACFILDEYGYGHYQKNPDENAVVDICIEVGMLVQEWIDFPAETFIAMCEKFLRENEYTKHR